MTEHGDRGRLAGLILIAVGLVLLAIQYLGGLGDSLVFFILGGLFLLGYLQRRAYGLLIPAGILLGIGLGSVGERVFAPGDGLENLGLGIGFLMIYFVDRIYRGTSRWWPLIPGGILLVVGLANTSRRFAEWMEVGWPIVLMLIGLILLLGVGSSRGRG